MPETYTIHQLTRYIRNLFEDDPALGDVWVAGEVSNFKRAASGHRYFTLKDDQSELSCVMWRSQADSLRFEPQHGDAVLAHGHVSVYEARGQYQLYCDTLQAAGAGDLHRQFELLKARLDADGLFDEARKRPIPAFPRQVGVVTSPTTAAFQDIQNVIRRRYPLAAIILSPTPVQGDDAPPQIVAAIARLNDHTAVDVIVVARGGGSLEDLWSFNDEAVVRAVVDSRIPVVTGVGHEIDFTLVDFVADQRAPTPSAAAEVVTPDGPALRLTIEHLTNRLAAIILGTLQDQRSAVTTSTRWLARLSPAAAIQDARQRIDDLTGRMARAARYDLARRRDRLQAQTQALEGANPRALLRRGYAIITRRSDGHHVTSAQDAAEGTHVDITLHDGRLRARVRERTMEG